MHHCSFTSNNEHVVKSTGQLLLYILYKQHFIKLPHIEVSLDKTLNPCSNVRSLSHDSHGNESTKETCCRTGLLYTQQPLLVNMQFLDQYFALTFNQVQTVGESFWILTVLLHRCLTSKNLPHTYQTNYTRFRQIHVPYGNPESNKYSNFPTTHTHTPV